MVLIIITTHGAVRNRMIMQIMVKAFEIAGYDEEVLKAKFGALYNAFQFGAPQGIWYGTKLPGGLTV